MGGCVSCGGCVAAPSARRRHTKVATNGLVYVFDCVCGCSGAAGATTATTAAGASAASTVGGPCIVRPVTTGIQGALKLWDGYVIHTAPLGLYNGE